MLRKSKIFIAVGLVVGIILLIVKPFSCDLRRSNVIPSLYTYMMEHAGYTPVSESPDPILPDTLNLPPESSIEQTISGSGVWVAEEPVSAGDSIPVELSAITLDDGSRWVKLTIAGSEAKWYRTEWFDREEIRRWKIHVEATNCESSPVGVGVGYQICEPLSIEVIPSISVSTQLDWIAPEIQFSGNLWSGVGLGLGIGYRFFEEPGTHVSGSVHLSL